MKITEPEIINPLYTPYHERFDIYNDYYCEYHGCVQDALDDGLIAVDDSRFCDGVWDTLHHLFLYTKTIQRGLHYARLILKRKDDCVAPELIQVCESLVEFRWPEHKSWHTFLDSHGWYASVWWPCPSESEYLYHFCPAMILGGYHQAKTNKAIRIELAKAKAKVAAEEAISTATEPEFDW